MKVNKIYNAIAVISCVCIVWIIASFIDVNAHNLSDCSYAGWNFFNIFESEEEKEVSVRSPPLDKKAQNKKPEKPIKPKHNFRNCISAKVSRDDVMNLARIIHAENGGHPNDEALVLTGLVVLKRVKSKQFPNTIMGVVSQKGQYATWMDGKFYCKPSKRSLKIARRLLTTDLADKYPDNLVFQAEFSQGNEVYRKLGVEYFCLGEEE